jgi:hypothetical protein
MTMNLHNHLNQLMTRRQFFGRTSTGIGTLALASLLNESGAAADVNASHGVVKQFDYPPRARRVIFLFQSGGPSQMDLFDPKPKLNELTGQPMPESLTNGQRVAQLQGQKLVCVGSRYKFATYGQAGVELSELLPWTSKIVDDVTMIRSLETDAINHDPAVTFFQTGNQQPGRPTMGAWLSYGLGSENQNLPAFVVLISGVGQGQNLHARYWGNGFLPSVHQGVQFRPNGDPVLFLSNPQGIPASARRFVLDGLRELNAMRLESIHDPEISTRIDQYEMAYRMQTSVPDLMDISDETVKWPAGDNDTLVAAIEVGGKTAAWDEHAPAGKKAWYRVFCVRHTEDGYKVLTSSAAKSITAPAEKPAPEPKSMWIDVAVDGGHVVVTWEACGGDQFSHYRILRKTGEGTTVVAEIENAGSTTWVDESVEVGGTYKYLVQSKGKIEGSWVLLGSTDWAVVTVE